METTSAGGMVPKYTKLAVNLRPWLAAILLFFGAPWLIVGVSMLVNNVLVMSNFEKVTATVIEIGEPFASGGQTMYRYKYRFTFNENEYEVWAKEETPMPPHIGKAITVHVNPKKPADVTEVEMGGVIFLLIFGSLLTALGVIVLVKYDIAKKAIRKCMASQRSAI